MDSAIARGGHPFESVSGETGVKIGDKTLFLDGAVWLNRAANLAFANFELKTPETDARDAELLKNGAEKARALQADYFVTWNMRDTIVWRVPHKGELFTDSLAAYDKFPPLTEITGVGDLTNRTKEILLRERALQILDLLARAKREGHFHQIDLDTTFFVGKLREATNTLAPLFAQSLAGTRARDRSFNGEIEAWRVKQGIKSGASDENEVIARQTVYRLLAKVIFYQAMRRSHTLPVMDFGGVAAASFQRKLAGYLAQARAIDYQAVFIEDITDRIPIPEFAAAALEKLIADLQRYNFSQMPEDVIGTVFQELIPAGERHTLGQYFTSTNLADLVLGFCVRSPKDSVIDPTCGTGTFLVRAYDMKHKLGGFNHLQLLSQIWGVDIAAFPAELATINLFAREISEYANFPRVLHRDFFEVKPGDKFEFPPPKPSLDPGLKIIETIPSFDAAIGNFPFIRQELIEQKVKGYKGKLDQVLERDWRGQYAELFKNGETKLSGQADIYAYLFFHTAPFVKSDGRLGFITGNGWLDASYGWELQKFFLRKFKLIAILESRCEPWFEDSSVNTVVTILERCESAAARASNVVKFVKIKRRLADLIPQDLKLYPLERWQNVAKLAARIESAHTRRETRELTAGLRVYEDEDFRIRMKSQADLLAEVEAEGKTVKWGPLLRAPDVFFEILEHAGKALVPLSDVTKEIKRGQRTGRNEFFYLDGSRVSYWQIEKEFLLPVLKSTKQHRCPIVEGADLAKKLFFCAKTKEELRRAKKLQALKYIAWGENQKTRDGKSWSEGDPHWYHLQDIEPAQLFWPLSHDQYHRVLYAPKPVCADQRTVPVYPKKDIPAKLLAALMNSTPVLFFIEVIGRVGLGDGLLDTPAEEAKNYMIVPDPTRLSPKETAAIANAFEKLAKRDVVAFKDEVKKEDRRVLDLLVLKALGLSPRILPGIYAGMVQLIDERLLIARMRASRSANRSQRDSDKILSDVIEEILPKRKH
jgi:type I restriction-modification system DNA methylase subunit